MHPPHSLDDSNANPKLKTLEEKGIGVRSLVCSTSQVEGCGGVSGWGLRRITRGSIIHTNLHKPNNKLLSL
jgi:hypothetical protein